MPAVDFGQAEPEGDESDAYEDGEFDMNASVDFEDEHFTPSAAALAPRPLRVASVVNQQGKMLWAIFDSSFGPEQQIRFMRAVVEDSKGRKIKLIKVEPKM